MIDSAPKFTIGLLGSEAIADLRLLDWLGAAYGAAFKRMANAGEPVDGVICFGDAPQNPAPVKTPCLRLVGLPSEAPCCVQSVIFGQDDATPKMFRGRTVKQRVFGLGAAAPGAGQIVIAQADGRPVWTRSVDQSNRADTAYLPLPPLTSNPSFFEYFYGDSFINLLPLVDFVRKVTGQNEWSAPSLPACFMFDDPNLHWGDYGFIRYGELVRHARQWRYHASFATIPIDGWFTNRGAAELLTANGDVLSLLVHGNDHLRNELAAYPSKERALASLAQALRRIDRMQTGAGCKISRVMAAPFGACTEESMDAMARLGFDAACISSGSLRLHNEESPWTASLGLRKSEWVCGLPIVPRFKMGKEAMGSILLSAYLDRPVVLMGHHEDVADGLDTLKFLAEFINGIQCAKWGDMAFVAHSNYLYRREGQMLRVQPYSRRVDVAIPNGVAQISIDSNAADGIGENVAVSGGAGQNGAGCRQAIHSPIETGGAERLTLSFERADAVDPYSVPSPGLNLWAFARRQLTEGRDRMRPIANRLRKAKLALQ